MLTTLTRYVNDTVYILATAEILKTTTNPDGAKTFHAEDETSVHVHDVCYYCQRLRVKGNKGLQHYFQLKKLKHPTENFEPLHDDETNHIVFGQRGKQGQQQKDEDGYYWVNLQEWNKYCVSENKTYQKQLTVCGVCWTEWVYYFCARDITWIN
jgi:hypothetical protein